MNYKEQINKQKIPQHVAIIMDGNGRWAEKQGKPRSFGHRNGVDSVRDCVEAAAEIGIKYLTLYAFSTENWNRPKEEVILLMNLLVEAITNETENLMKNQIQLRIIGDIQQFEDKYRKKLDACIKETSVNHKMVLILALSYSSKWEILNAVKEITKMVESKKIKAEDVDEKFFESKLNTYFCPDPELLIRTSGEYRLSNFLLWQIAYAELYFTNKCWPEFRKNDFFEAILDFQKRERRFGKVSSQII